MCVWVYMKLLVFKQQLEAPREITSWPNCKEMGIHKPDPGLREMQKGKKNSERQRTGTDSAFLWCLGSTIAVKSQHGGLNKTFTIQTAVSASLDEGNLTRSRPRTTGNRWGLEGESAFLQAQNNTSRSWIPSGQTQTQACWWAQPGLRAHVGNNHD